MGREPSLDLSGLEYGVGISILEAWDISLVCLPITGCDG